MQPFIVGKGNGLCIECQDKEDVEHVLFACEKYNDVEQYGRREPYSWYTWRKGVDKGES